MNNTVKGTKKSGFTGSTTIPSGSYLDFVVNGQNLRIKDTDFYAALAVTGSIVQEGDPSGTPMLDKQGSVNAIRNITAGFGISSTINPYNGITLSTDFTFDETGAKLVDDPSSPSPTFKSLTSTDSSVTLTETPSTINFSVIKSASNVNIVTKASDFPAPSGGVIELDPNTAWDIQNADVTVAAPFKCLGPASIYGRSATSRLSYAGAGDLFTSIDAGDLDVYGLRMNFPNADMLNMRGNLLPLTGFFRFRHCTIEGAKSFGVYKDLLGVSFFDIVAGLFSPTAKFDNGLTDIGTLTSFLTVAKMGYYSESPTFVGFDLGSNPYVSLEIANTRFTGPVGSVGISGLANSANLAVGEVASITSCEFTGGCVGLAGIDEKDIRYDFVANGGIPDTAQDALLSLTSNATPTVISAINTPTLVLGTWVSESLSHFTGTAAGRATYIGERQINAPITAALTVEPVSGTNKDVAACIAINGSVIAGSCVVVRADNSNPLSMTVIWQATLAENDYIEVFVENRTDAVDVLVQNAVLRVL